MTALDQYDRLECPGVWREHATAQRRDVVVALGEASLVMTDTAGRVVAHWSLAAVERQGREEGSVIFAPGPEAPERLEVEDSLMIGAIERVRGAIERRRPHPGRLRASAAAAVLLLCALLVFFWLPGALVRYTASVVPEAARSDIGYDILQDLSRITGPSCASTGGQLVLEKLQDRLLGRGGGRIVVLPTGPDPTAHLPGGLTLVTKELVEDFESPEVVAGYVLAEDLRREQHDPLTSLLEAAGFSATFRLLTTGTVPEAARHAYSEQLFIRESKAIEPGRLIARFSQARLPVTPYAYAVDMSGESTLGLIEADASSTTASEAILSDEDWVTLQGICGG